MICECLFGIIFPLLHPLFMISALLVYWIRFPPSFWRIVHLLFVLSICIVMKGISTIHSQITEILKCYLAYGPTTSWLGHFSSLTFTWFLLLNWSTQRMRTRATPSAGPCCYHWEPSLSLSLRRTLSVQNGATADLCVSKAWFTFKHSNRMAFGHLVPQLKLEEATEDGLFRNISTLHPSQHAPNQRGKTVSPYNTRKQQK